MWCQESCTGYMSKSAAKKKAKESHSHGASSSSWEECTNARHCLVFAKVHEWLVSVEGGSVVRPACLDNSRHFLLIFTAVLAVQLSRGVVRRTVWVRIMQQRLNNSMVVSSKITCQYWQKWFYIETLYWLYNNALVFTIQCMFCGNHRSDWLVQKKVPKTDGFQQFRWPSRFSKVKRNHTIWQIMYYFI